MSHTVERYKNDIDSLVKRGEGLLIALLYDCAPNEAMKKFKSKREFDQFVSKLPRFIDEYQAWYSEAKIVIKVLLPDRLNDFVRYYEKPKTRNHMNSNNYSIEDYLNRVQVLSILQAFDDDYSAAIPLFEQQIAIVKGMRSIFENSLFEIRFHLQAEMFDDELEAASYLLKNRFIRAAGAMAGVVLERHLKQVCLKHGVKISSKKHLSISDYNDALQREKIVDTADWRKIQHLGDLRNKCDHDKDTEPTNEDVIDLIDGVVKVTKTLF